jgi:hypothetical protein
MQKANTGVLAALGFEARKLRNVLNCSSESSEKRNKGHFKVALSRMIKPTQAYLGFGFHQVNHKGGSCKHNEHEKQHLGNVYCTGCNTAKAKQSSYQCDHEKNNSVVQHDQLLGKLIG